MSLLVGRVKRYVHSGNYRYKAMVYRITLIHNGYYRLRLVYTYHGWKSKQFAIEVLRNWSNDIQIVSNMPARGVYDKRTLTRFGIKGLDNLRVCASIYN